MLLKKSAPVAQAATAMLSRRMKATHTVFNQSVPLEDFNLFESDPVLVSFMKSKCTPEQIAELSEFGEMAGSVEMIRTADLAEKNRPTLRQFDQFGNRIDIVDYHQSYHELMDFSTFNGCSADGFKIKREGSHVHRCAKSYMSSQLEPGHGCPITMTFAAIPVLQKNPGMEKVVEKIFSKAYDHRNLPMEEKTGVNIGMSMTEKQGGTDVRANTTIATPEVQGKTGQGEAYLLNGHKWFTSAPMSDGFLTLAKLAPESPPTCFFVPRWKPNGSRNSGFQVMRLKDKLADRANASSEVEYSNAWGTMLGEPDRGVKTIIEMVQATRLDCILGSAGHARRALQQALNHAKRRSAFGKVLTRQPLMQNVLADLCVEAEAHTLTAFHMASAFDKYYAGASEGEKEVFRLGVSVGKYYVTKRLPQFTYECLEVFGGNGFVEEQPMAKMYRHAPLNAIWEGSGNVIALDILRGFKALPHLWKDITSVRGSDSIFDTYCDSLHTSLEQVAADPLNVVNQRAARNIVERLAVAMQGSILLRHGDPLVAEAFMASRIASSLDRVGAGGLHGGATIFSEQHAEHMIKRNMPVFTGENYVANGMSLYSLNK